MIDLFKLIVGVLASLSNREQGQTLPGGSF
jgi:hypothetical protein